jgi:hypothetical protein
LGLGFGLGFGFEFGLVKVGRRFLAVPLILPR